MTDCNPLITKNSSLYRDKNIIKVGNTQDGNYRGVFLIYPKQEISKSLVQNGFTANHDYTPISGNVTFTVTPNSQKQNMFAYMLPFDSGVDETVTWFKSSEKSNTKWASAGGDISPVSYQTRSLGTWNGNSVTFDITAFLSLWKSNGSDSLSIAIEPTNVGVMTELFSKTNPTSRIGNETLLNCSFLKGGQTQAFDTEGVRVVMYHENSNTVIERRDDSPKGNSVWRSLLNTVSIGNSFDIFSPDTEQDYSLGKITCTLTEKRCDSMIVSGVSLPVSGEYYTTLEFSGTSTIEAGVGILQISSPNSRTKQDLFDLKTNDEISVQYLASVIENNVKTFTVDFTSDETLKMNRYRIYLKQIPYSENRTGKPTDVFLKGQAPVVKLDLLVY